MRKLLIIRLLCLWAVFATSAGNAADDPRKIFESAAHAFEVNYREAWSFTEERQRKGVTWVGRWDPRDSRHWTLLSVDGHEPSASERDTYQHDKAEEMDRQKDRDQSPTAMVTSSSLKLLDETADAWHFRFQPRGEGDNARIMKDLTGTMTIAKRGPVITMIEVYNMAPFKPKFGFKVRKFLSRFDFARAPDGPMVPIHADFQISAKAIGLMNIDERVTVEYRDYAKVDPSRGIHSDP
ncbi:MAG TPA: hypothetical protein VJ998_02555 [Pseudomonadales bacterium]|nr:hypothetical protein [Pseudomonadales bacterium]